MQDMIKSILLVDDEDLFHMVFEDACSYLDIALNLTALSSSDEADRLFAEWKKDPSNRPECVFVDLNIIGSSFDGIELIRRINQIHGNGVVIGIISSSSDQEEIDKSKTAGAQFWLVKSDEIEPRLENFRKDYDGFVKRETPFRLYS
jgi:CheY-like chemotaxis protein